MKLTDLQVDSNNNYQQQVHSLCPHRVLNQISLHLFFYLGSRRGDPANHREKNTQLHQTRVRNKRKKKQNLGTIMENKDGIKLPWGGNLAPKALEESCLNH